MIDADRTTRSSAARGVNIYFEARRRAFTASTSARSGRTSKGGRLDRPRATAARARRRCALVTDKDWERHGASAFGWLAPASCASSSCRSATKRRAGSPAQPPAEAVRGARVDRRRCLTCPTSCARRRWPSERAPGSTSFRRSSAASRPTGASPSGRAYRDSTEAFVAEATCEDGTPAVLKLIVPATVTRRARGDGPAARGRRRLRAAVAGRRRSRRTPARAAGPLAPRARVADSPAARDPRRRREANLASCARLRPADRRRESALARRVHHVDVGGARPSVQRTRRRACTRVRGAVAATRIATRPRSLVHGDVHQWNALEADGGFKLVDPDGLLAEPEYDLGIIMREDPLEGDLHERARWLAHDDRARRDGDLGVGRRRARLDRPARHARRPSADRRGHAGRRGSTGRLTPRRQHVKGAPWGPYLISTAPMRYAGANLASQVGVLPASGNASAGHRLPLTWCWFTFTRNTRTR